MLEAKAMKKMTRRRRRRCQVECLAQKGRHTTQLRKHTKKCGKFIKFFQSMADAEGMDACDFFPTDEQAALEDHGCAGESLQNRRPRYQYRRVGLLIYCKCVAEA